MTLQEKLIVKYTSLDDSEVKAESKFQRIINPKNNTVNRVKSIKKVNDNQSTFDGSKTSLLTSIPRRFSLPPIKDHSSFTQRSKSVMAHDWYLNNSPNLSKMDSVNTTENYFNQNADFTSTAATIRRQREQRNENLYTVRESGIVNPAILLS